MLSAYTAKCEVMRLYQGKEGGRLHGIRRRKGTRWLRITGSLGIFYCLTHKYAKIDIGLEVMN
jgi:hypothetical protein